MIEANLSLSADAVRILSEISEEGGDEGEFVSNLLREWRKSGGRPGARVRPDEPGVRTFDALRTLSVQLAHETALGVTGEPIIRNGLKMTVAERILWGWATSSDFQRQEKFLEYCSDQLDGETQKTAIS